MVYLIEVNGTQNITFMDKKGNYEFDSQVYIENNKLYIDCVDCEDYDSEKHYESLMDEVHYYRHHLLICLLINTIYFKGENNSLYIYKSKLYSDKSLKKEIKIFPLLFEKLESYDFNYTESFSLREERWNKLYNEVYEVITNLKDKNDI
jgi:hypothetical protein